MQQGTERRIERLAALEWRGDETVVDVGGGNGTLLSQLIEVQPGLSGIVFDLPETVRDEAALGERIAFVEGSFFERVPEGDVYILSTILHDWDDESAAAILQTIRKAAPPGARLLVIETILPEGNEPNGAKWLDLLMLTLFGGRERNDEQWQALLVAGGFEPVSMEDGDRGAMSLTVGTAGHIDHGKTALVRASRARTPTGCRRSSPVVSPSSSATRRSISPTDAASSSSTFRATSASCERWSRVRPASISSS